MIVVNFMKFYNKSNAKAGAEQVEANLQEQLGNHLQFRQQWAFTTLGMSRFELLLAHGTPE